MDVKNSSNNTKQSVGREREGEGKIQKCQIMIELHIKTNYNKGKEYFK